MKLSDYPSSGNDPDTLDFDAWEKQFKANFKELQVYGDAMNTQYNRTRMFDERLSVDLKQAFRPPSIKALSGPMILEWADFLHHRGFFVGESIIVGRHDAVIEVITRGSFKPSLLTGGKEVVKNKNGDGELVWGQKKRMDVQVSGDVRSNIGAKMTIEKGSLNWIQVTIRF